MIHIVRGYERAVFKYEEWVGGLVFCDLYARRGDGEIRFPFAF